MWFSFSVTCFKLETDQSSELQESNQIFMIGNTIKMMSILVKSERVCFFFNYLMALYRQV